MDLTQDTVKKIRGLIVFAVAVVVAGINYRSVLLVFMRFVGMLAPFLLGAAIAFVLNVPMRWIENHIRTGKSDRVRRAVSLSLALLAVAGILSVVMVLVVPEVFRTLSSLQRNVPVFFAGLQAQLEAFFSDNPDVIAYINSVEIDWEQLMQQIVAFLSDGAGTVLSTTFSAAMSIVNGVTCFGIGLIFAIYILLQKETLERQMRKVLRAFLPGRTAARVLEVAALTERTFSNFLTGQCVEAVILGLMFFVTLTVFRMPYALLIGVLIAFTALIPIFGAFIGCAVGAFLILIMNPVQALVFIGIFLVLQQIEGNLIYPHVVGNSVGLPSIWVLVAVTLGGSMMGILGMLIFIPLVSVIYSLFRDEVNARLKRRGQKS
ncbi:AI-2E family transporter [Clostridium sp. AN503]|uniref:AI-2E family transporter n=1 Tax=Clostridium sp. AN503 TaxID=3160598 RepID=UPI00345A4B57